MLTPKQKTQQEAILTAAHTDFHKGLNVYAAFKVSDRAISEDLVQDTFLKTWHYLVKGGKIETMRAFLYHVLNNLIVNEYRKRKHKTASLDVLLEKGYEPGARTETERLFNVLDAKSSRRNGSIAWNHLGG